ncbi:MAG TPA: ABC transporter ATP-binding protein [Vicinamibacterales bacterium]
MAQIILRSLEKRFGSFLAVSHLDLEVHEGELMTLLGPSGCGKTTTLRMIAGLEIPTAGRIELAGQTLNDTAAGIAVPPERRGMGMVFQSYAVWPHMTVARNIDYPLRIRKVARDERERRLARTLELVQLAGYADRYPHQLSGGQQQRVALARGLIMEPAVLLLDEPLSNLDAKLRRAMRREIRAIQRALRMTMLYVTHDREEAEEISDRMAVLVAGRLAQVATPAEIQSSPADDEVRGFFAD